MDAQLKYDGESEELTVSDISCGCVLMVKVENQKFYWVVKNQLWLFTTNCTLLVK